jgi:hypothetical protein
VIAFLDCSTGASGDKLLGALVDAGFDLGSLRSALASVDLGSVTVASERVRRRGVSGVAISVAEDGAPRRTWRDLALAIERAAVPPTVAEGALRALRELAEAEARVHSVALDDVHFHEIGAADTIADILGVALGLHELGIDELACERVAVGSGNVATEHGTLPVPAPATALLLEGVPIETGPCESELTTPTGAALLRAFVTRWGPMTPMTVRRVGCGAGARDLPVANVARVLVGEPIPAEAGDEPVTLMETNLDHLTPEQLAYAAERLLDAGALDVWQTPIVMKKGRPGVLLSVLSTHAEAGALAQRLLLETGSLGVRMRALDRTTLAREVASADTSMGSARFKIATLPDGSRVARVEYEDATRVARERDEPLAEVMRALETEAAASLGAEPNSVRQDPPG